VGAARDGAVNGRAISRGRNLPGVCPPPPTQLAVWRSAPLRARKPARVSGRHSDRGREGGALPSPFNHFSASRANPPLEAAPSAFQLYLEVHSYLTYAVPAICRHDARRNTDPRARDRDGGKP